MICVLKYTACSYRIYTVVYTIMFFQSNNSLSNGYAPANLLSSSSSSLRTIAVPPSISIHLSMPVSTSFTTGNRHHSSTPPTSSLAFLPAPTFTMSTTPPSISTTPMSPPPSSSPPPTPTDFAIIGSGVSTGIPRISCIIRPTPEYTCRVCHDAQHTPNSKNRRGNVCAIVRSCGRTIMIDCGKTIRETAMRNFPKLGIRQVDAIVLTHGHADAMLGLDDARDIQTGAKRVTIDGRLQWTPPDPTPVFLNEDTMRVCRNVFPYLMPPELQPNAEKQDISRRVAAVDWRPYNEDAYFVPFRPIEDTPIEFTPIPMLHGGDYVCMGFIIKVRSSEESSDEKTVVFLSDLHEMPARSLQVVKALPQIDLLVIDILTFSDLNRSHLSLDQAQDLVREIQPMQAVGVGMTCSLGMHDEVNKVLSEMEDEGIKFRLSYDGERFGLE